MSFVLGLLVGVPVGFGVGVALLLAHAAHKIARRAWGECKDLSW